MKIESMTLNDFTHHPPEAVQVCKEIIAGIPEAGCCLTMKTCNSGKCPFAEMNGSKWNCGGKIRVKALARQYIKISPFRYTIYGEKIKRGNNNAMVSTEKHI